MDQKPIELNSKKKTWENFKKQVKFVRVIDKYDEQLKELFLIRNPRYRFIKNYQVELTKFLQEKHKGKKVWQIGNWFYFPWNKHLVHYLPDSEHQEIRTARNKNLITQNEQNKFYNFKVGVAGLSVGSHGALTLAMMGGGKHLRLSDPDSISASNLNRIRTDFTNIGANKCEWVSQQIYQINPYTKIDSYPEGINPKNVKRFLAGPTKLDVVIDSLDSLSMKIHLRIMAKKLRIPVLMATDNGDSIVFDIERYDLKPDLTLFHGALGKLTPEQVLKLPPTEMPRLATRIAGPNFITPRMLESISLVGKTLYSWPQLGDAATLCGVAIAYAVKSLAIGKIIRDGKFALDLDTIFEPERDRKINKQKTHTARKKALQRLDL